MKIKDYILLALVCFNILISLGIYYKNDNESINNDYVSFNDNLIENTNEEKINTSNFYVEIKGAVSHPGVFLVNDQNIINDLVELAGGFKKDAYTKNINLAYKLKEGMVVYIYANNEYKEKDDSKINICSCPTYDIKSCEEKDSSIIEVGNSTSSNEETSLLVNINTASKEELTTLNGIGDAKAESIINYRKENGLFSSIKDIKNISGISDTIYEKIKDSITV